MPLYSTILCAVDFSEHSRLALKTALDLASRGPARVIAQHTIDLLLAEAAAAAYDEERLKADATAELRAFAEPLAHDGAVPEILVEIGRPEGTIVATARERKADLIVLGTQGLGGLRKIFFGSVAEKVLREAEVPVLALTAEGSADALPPFSGVLAAVDFDACQQAVVSHASALASELGLPLTIVHAVQPLSALPQYTAALGAAEAERTRAAEARLAEIASTVGVPVETEILSGKPADAIAERAGRTAGLIVVIGLGGGRLLHRPGSTAYRVLCLTRAPVMAVP